RGAEEGSASRGVARVYAEALLDVAADGGQPAEIGQELDSLVREVFAQSPEVEAAFASPVMKRAAKVTLLEHAFRGKVSDLMFHFLNVLNAKDRLGLVRHVAAPYPDLLAHPPTHIPSPVP